MTENNALTPFRIDIAQADVDDLRNRLTHPRWPIPVPGRDDRTDFSRGIPLVYLKELAEYWRDGFDWRAQEAKLNEYEQFTTVVDGQTFHLVHARSANPEATPLILNHGWPGSFVEYQRLLPLLADGFHVVIPSPPGFGFSTPLSGTGWELARTTEAYAEIMTRLGYARFAAHGTDMGSGITGRLAALYPERVIGTHIGADPRWLGLVGDKFPLPDGLSDDEIAQLESAHRGCGRSRVPRDAEPPP
ncbi:epoxide hydrolase family protein [Nocardia gipuzkoensis]